MGGRCDVATVVGDGLCHAHYQQIHRRGLQARKVRAYRPIGLSGRDLAEWFLVNSTALQGACLVWIYAKANGYPAVRIDGRRVGLHRFERKALLQRIAELEALVARLQNGISE